MQRYAAAERTIPSLPGVTGEHSAGEV